MERARLGHFAKANDSEDKLHRAKSLHAMGELDAAISQLRTLIEGTTYSPPQGHAYELLIEWLIEIRENNEAKRIASSFMANHKDSPSVEKIITLFNKSTTPEKSKTPPEPVTAAPPEPKNEEAGQNSDEDFLLELEQISASSDSKNQLHNFMLAKAPITAIEKIWGEQKNRPLTGLCGARLAFHYFHLGELARAYDIASKAFMKTPAHIQEELTSLQKKIDILRKVDMSAIGILLPLSGPFAAFGKKALTAMSIAFGIPMPLTNQPISVFKTTTLKIIVADSAAPPGNVNDVVDTLAVHYGVALIIGEITTDTSLSAAIKSHQYGIPMLSLSRHPLMTNLSDNIFIFSTSFNQQIEHLINYAMKEKQHTNFAIVFPRHNYGISMAKAFYEGVVKNKGHISAMESYDTHETTFNETARKLVSTHFLSARNEYNQCHKQASIESNKNARDDALKLCKESLKPIVDFDAIFVPEFQSLSFLVPALVQEDILLTNNVSAKKNYAATTKIEDPKAVQMLGPSSWNDDSIINRLAAQVNGAVFVDSIDKLSPDLQAFTKAFSALNVSAPSTLEVFAHDAAKLSEHILLDISKDPTTEKNRLTVQERLAHFNKKIGLLENISFVNRELRSPLISFEIMNGQARPLVITEASKEITALEHEKIPSLSAKLSHASTQQTVAQKN